MRKVNADIITSINEVVKIRGGQYKLALKRDVLVDFNEQIMNSPCFVEKGSISDYNSPSFGYDLNFFNTYLIV